VAVGQRRYPPPLGVIVLDVDPRNGGSAALLELTRQHGALPATLTARTGGGGLHIWLTHTGRSRGQLCTGVDVKTSAGYVVAPSSLHASGQRYQWVTQPRGRELGIVPAPAWVAQVLHPPAPPHRAHRAPMLGASKSGLVGLLRVVIDAPEGNRNNALYWASRRMLQKVADGDLAECAAVGMLADAATAVGLTGAEIDRTIGSTRRVVLGG